MSQVLDDEDLITRLQVFICEHTRLHHTSNPYVFEVQSNLEHRCQECATVRSLLIVKHDGTVWNCWKKKKPTKVGTVYTNELKFQNNSGSVTPRPVGRESEYMGKIPTDQTMWAPGVDIQEYDDETEHVLPFETILQDRPSIRCIAIRAGMSLGKTTALVEELRRYLNQHPEARVLCVGSRRAFVSTLMCVFKEFSFCHYRYGQEQNTNTTTRDNVVQDTIRVLTEEQYNDAERTEYLERVIAHLQRYVNSKVVSRSQFYDQCEEHLTLCQQILSKLHNNYSQELDALRKMKIARDVQSLLCSQMQQVKDDILKKQSHYLNADRLVIQYESLARLNGKKKFDLVILDEARSIMTNMCTVKTNPGSKLAYNSLMLRRFLQSARLSIHTDANLEWDCAVPTFLQSIYEPHEIAVRHYNRVKMRRRLRAIPGQDDFLVALYKKMESVLNDEKSAPIALCCRTRTNAVMYRELLEKEYPGHRGVRKIRIEMFTGKSDAHQIRAFEDIEKFMNTQKPDVVILTSAVTVGADVQVLFDSVFVDFQSSNGQGCSAQNILQMIGRFRNLTNWEVLVVYKELPVFYSALMEDFHQQMEQKTDLVHKWSATIQRITHRPLTATTLESIRDNYECKERSDGVIELAPNWFSRLFLIESIDKQQSQEYLMFAHARRSGWRVFVDQPPQKQDRKAESDEVKAAKRAKIAEDEERERQVFETLQSKCKFVDEMTQVATDSSSVAKSNDAQDMRALANVAHVLKYFVHENRNEEGPTAADTMNYKDFKQAKKYNTAVWNLAKAQSEDYTKEDEAEHELKSKSAFFNINHKLTFLQKERTEELLKTLGIDQACCETTITLDVVNANAKEMCKLADMLTVARGQHVKQDKSQKAPHSACRAVTRLSNELKYLFGTHIEPHWSNGSRTHYMYKPFKPIKKLADMGNHSESLKNIHERNNSHKRPRDNDNNESR